MDRSSKKSKLRVTATSFIPSISKDIQKDHNFLTHLLGDEVDSAVNKPTENVHDFMAHLLRDNESTSEHDDTEHGQELMKFIGKADSDDETPSGFKKHCKNNPRNGGLARNGQSNKQGTRPAAELVEPLRRYKFVLPGATPTNADKVSDWQNQVPELIEDLEPPNTPSQASGKQAQTYESVSQSEKFAVVQQVLSENFQAITEASPSALIPPTAEQSIEAYKRKIALNELRKSSPEQKFNFSSNRQNTQKYEISLRHAQPYDVLEMEEIYTSWADNSHVVMDSYDFPSLKEIIVDAGLPWIVAVKRTRGRSAEEIVGFSMACDFGLREDSHRFSVIAQVFVHPNYLQEGVGTALLEKLLNTLDSKYSPGDQSKPTRQARDASDAWVRKIYQILIEFPYRSCDERMAGWMARWLDDFGFQCVGNMRDVAFLHDDWVSQATFQRPIKPN